MGVLTYAEIVDEGQLLAGRDDNADASLGWLKRWLNAVAASWPWPQLQGESFGVELLAGRNYIEYGNGAGTLVGDPIGSPSYKVLKILDNIWLYNSDKTMRKRLRVRHQLTSSSDFIDPATNIGTPTAVRVFGDWETFGQWGLTFDKTADQTYLLTIPHIILPPAPAATSEIPWYPNDETMVQLVAFKNHQYYDGPDASNTAAAQQQLAGLIAQDRTRYGNAPGINDSLSLDPAVFKSRRLG